MTPISDSTAIELSFAPEWTVFGPCGESDPAPVFADLAACPATLRLGGKELTARKVRRPFAASTSVPSSEKERYR